MSEPCVPAIQTKGISVSFDGKKILHDVNVSAPKRAITAIIGPSGCGKTTLLSTLNALIMEQPGASVSGSVLLDGEDTRRIPREELRRKVGMVTQTPSPFPFSIYRNLAYAPKYYRTTRKQEMDELVRQKLELVGLYDEVQGNLKQNALTLSGGQQQRLCIARALTVDPQVLLLDEPCSALDVKATAKIESTLLTLKQQYCIVIVTHNIAQARRIADYAVFMNDGRIIETAPARQLFESPSNPVTRDFLAGAFG
ncbi:MAG: phosphate ABC transporter ATP-binding protein [Eggerthellaceae bacterium]|nr:phosphate ABC transporter ATP-binding protein [Eggerthellaceae bacterium]